MNENTKIILSDIIIWGALIGTLVFLLSFELFVVVDCISLILCLVKSEVSEMAQCHTATMDHTVLLGISALIGLHLVRDAGQRLTRNCENPK